MSDRLVRWRDRLRCIQMAARLLVYLSACVAIGSPALAQDVSGKNVPVINPQPDLNGVDVATGSYNVASPFRFEAPGAGHLSSQLVFNGRKLTTTLNVYLDDQTLIPWGQDPSGRQIRVHAGGIDRLFDCPNIGKCTQVAKIDGSVLTRTATNSYSFVDRDGTSIAFFPMQIQLLDSCVDFEAGCNAAEYQGYAYAATVTYSNGERLTFSELPQVSSGNFILTVSSNLGYTLDVSTPCTNCTVNPAYTGAAWLMYRQQPFSATYTLRKAGQEVDRFSVNMTATNYGGTVRAGQLATEVEANLVDRISRNFYVKFEARHIATCGTPLSADGGIPLGWVTGTTMGAFDATNLVPVRVISPNGVQTDIIYKSVLQFSPSMNRVPVQSVSRGGETWLYNYTVSNSVLGADASLTSTDPESHSRTSWSRSYENPWPTSWGANDTNWCNGNAMGSDVVKATDELGHPTSFSYVWQGVVGSATLPEGNNQVYAYDDRGNLMKITAAPRTAIGGPAVVLFEAGFDEECTNPVKCNKPNWTRDAKGAQTDYVYDPVHGGPTQVTLPADTSGVRPQQRMTYEAFATSNGTLYRLQQVSECATQSSCSGGADEVRRSYTYWNSTLLKSSEAVQQGNGGPVLTTQYAYDDAGRLTQQTSPGGSSTWYFYDAVGRKIGTIGADPDGAGPLPQIAQRITYNNDDRIIRVEEGTVTGSTPAALAALSVSRATDTLYDPVGRKIRDSVSAGGSVHQVTQYSYDPVGRLKCTAVRMDPAQWGSQTDACVSQLNGPNGADRITKNVYDATGQLIQVWKAVGTPLQQAYATYSYTDNGKQEYVVDANGQRAKFVYDGFDRQTHWYFPAKTAVENFNFATQETALATAGAYSTSDYEQYEYDDNGNRTSLRKRSEAGQTADSQTIRYTYDALNRVAKKDLPGSEQDVYYAYDLRGLQTGAYFGAINGAGITNAYDGLGRLTSSTNTSDGVSRTLAYEYDADGNRTKVTHPDATYFTYHYDGLDRVTSIKENGATELVGITYDNQGWRDLMSYANGTKVDYGYDAVSRLASLSHDLEGTGMSRDVLFEYKGYNPASQLLERKVSNDLYVYRGDVNLNRGYTANGLNQYTVSGPRALDYDLNGNLKLEQASTNPTAADTANYAYDSENRLTSAWGKQTATLSYDPLGRLLQTSGGSAGATHFLYDGDALVGEYNSSGTLLRRYVHGPGVDEPLVWYEGSGIAATARRWLHANHQGSIVGVTDSAGYAMGPYQANTFDAYGIPAGLEWGPTTNLGRFQYTGQIWLPELEMYHYKARIYSPQLGRFLQTDPIGYDDQINLYAYVGNDPVNKTDPDGKEMVAKDLKERSALAAMINARASGTFRFNKDGKLERVGDSHRKGGSRTYTRQLEKGITAKQRLVLDISQTYKPLGRAKMDVDRNAGGGLTSRRLGEIDIVVSGNANTILRDTNGKPLRDEPADILAHEIAGHGVPKLVGGRLTGNAIDNENIIRRERGEPLRQRDPSHYE